MGKASMVGYVVVERCDDYEQVLGLKHADNYPLAGVLDWADKGYLFDTRAEAREAISRTEHYRLAFDRGPSLPEKCFCTIKPIEQEVN
jgi:hypothetical protein